MSVTSMRRSGLSLSWWRGENTYTVAIQILQANTRMQKWAWLPGSTQTIISGDAPVQAGGSNQDLHLNPPCHIRKRPLLSKRKTWLIRIRPLCQLKVSARFVFIVLETIRGTLIPEIEES
jgi:hypothetical protein